MDTCTCMRDMRRACAVFSGLIGALLCCQTCPTRVKRIAVSLYARPRQHHPHDSKRAHLDYVRARQFAWTLTVPVPSLRPQRYHTVPCSKIQYHTCALDGRGAERILRVRPTSPHAPMECSPMECSQTKRLSSRPPHVPASSRAEPRGGRKGQ